MPTPVAPPIIAPPPPLPPAATKRATTPAKPTGDPARADENGSSFEQTLKDVQKQETAQTPPDPADSKEPAQRTARASKTRKLRGNTPRSQNPDRPETPAAETPPQQAASSDATTAAVVSDLQLDDPTDNTKAIPADKSSLPQTEPATPDQQPVLVQAIVPEQAPVSPRTQQTTTPPTPSSRPGKTVAAHIEEAKPTPSPSLPADQTPVQSTENDPDQAIAPGPKVLSSEQHQPIDASAIELPPQPAHPAPQAEIHPSSQRVRSDSAQPRPQRTDVDKPDASAAAPQPQAPSDIVNTAPSVADAAPVRAEPRIAARFSSTRNPSQEAPADSPGDVEARVRQAPQPQPDQILPSLKEFFAQLMAADDPTASTTPVAPTDEKSPDATSAAATPSHPAVHRDTSAPAKTQSEPTPPATQFAETNHPRIITAIRSHLLPDGGTMQLRLDPPELGAITVRIDLHEGAVAAAFQTSNDQTTQLLSHSLGQLKHALESQGISVEKLQVERTPHEQRPGTSPDDSQQRQEQTPQQQQEQQRRELLHRMWRRLSGGADPLDVTA